MIDRRSNRMTGGSYGNVINDIQGRRKLNRFCIILEWTLPFFIRELLVRRKVVWKKGRSTMLDDFYWFRNTLSHYVRSLRKYSIRNKKKRKESQTSYLKLKVSCRWKLHLLITEFMTWEIAKTLWSSAADTIFILKELKRSYKNEDTIDK